MSDVGGGDYLPPVIAELIGKADQFKDTLDDAKSDLIEFSQLDPEAKLGANLSNLQHSLLVAKGLLDGYTASEAYAKIGANDVGVKEQIAAVQTMLAAVNRMQATVKITADDSAAGGLLAGILGNKLLGGGAKGGLGSILGWGAGGGVAGFGAGIGAGFGSLLGTAGLGLEHLLMTTIGMAGSATGGLMGGGLLGLGAAGVGGVGLATDASGLGQAAGDIKAVYQAQNQLNDAIAKFGPGSTQAKDALASYNNVLAGFSPIARTAVVAASNAAQQFHQMFDAVSGPAEKIGAEIIKQAIETGSKFLPTLGKYAAENMGIIKSGLQPLFQWFQGQGLQIFTQLEQEFQSRLPTAIHAFDQGVELVAKTISVASTYTGGFIKALDQFVTKWNQPPNFSRWSQEVGKLIGLFHTWEAFTKILVQDIYQIFHADAGTGTSIVQSLTQMLTKLHEYLMSSTGQNKLHSVFEAHKKEVIELLKFLPTLVSTFGQLEMAIAPPLTEALTAVLELFHDLLSIPDVGPVIEWGLAIAILANKMKLLTIASSALGGLKAVIGFFSEGGLQAIAGFAQIVGGRLVGGLQSLANTVGPLIGRLFGLEAAEGGAALGATEMNAALTLGALAGIVALAAGIYLLIKHFGLLKTALIVGAVAVGGLTIAFWALDAVPIVAIIVGIIAIIAALIAAIVLLIIHWKEVWNEVKAVASAVWGWIKSAAADTWNALKGAFDIALDAIKSKWDTVWNGIKAAASAVWNGIKSGAEGLWHALDAVWQSIVGAAQTAWNGLVTFLKGIPGDIVKALSALGGLLLALAHKAWGMFKDGVFEEIQLAIALVTTIPKMIINAFGDVGKMLFGVGKAIIQGLINGIKSMGSAVGGAIGDVVHIAKHVPVIGGLIGSPSPYFIKVGQAMMEGLQLGTLSGKGSVLSTVQSVVNKVQVTAHPLTGALVGSSGGGVSASFAPVYHITFNGATGNPSDINNQFQRMLRDHDRELILKLRSQLGTR